MSPELKEAAEEYLEAAYKYWKLANKELGGGAVFWLDDENGYTAIFTRGEYRSLLMSNIERNGLKPVTFGHLRSMTDADPEGWEKPLDLSENET